MSPVARIAAFLVALFPLASGCTEAITTPPTSVLPTPGAVLEPKAPDEAKAPDAAPAPAKAVAAAADPEVKLERLKWDALVARIAANTTKAKFTIVDAWTTDCGPCKENFPHLVAMHRKYGPKGLAVVSLSLDDNSDQRVARDAETFLKEQKATFTNVLLDEEFGVGYEKLDISAVPAVFLFGPNGKEVMRFTLQDVDNQFTYDQVEAAVAALLDGKPLPAEPEKKPEKKSDGK